MPFESSLILTAQISEERRTGIGLSHCLTMETLLSFDNFRRQLKKYIQENEFTYQEVADKVNQILEDITGSKTLFRPYNKRLIYRLLNGSDKRTVADENERKAFSRLLIGSDDFYQLLIPNTESIISIFNREKDNIVELLKKEDNKTNSNKNLTRQIDEIIASDLNGYIAQLSKANWQKPKVADIRRSFILDTYYHQNKVGYEKVSYIDAVKASCSNFFKNLATDPVLSNKLLSDLRNAIPKAGSKSDDLERTVLKALLSFSIGIKQ